ncbi:Long-chain base-1-phosphate phosphatase [Dimargaris xerosporica]|nr:Long-chain base-1-phosphate phosphatase [Dimargaris xerosporica]
MTITVHRHTSCTTVCAPDQHQTDELGSLDLTSAPAKTWRQRIRSYLLPRIAQETPWLASLQQRLRPHDAAERPTRATRWLDYYFVVTSLLGNHNFFLLFLPVLFWLGWGLFTRAFVTVILGSIYWSGCVKDWLALPRPPAPPLNRLTWSASHGFEYGFPSSHTSYMTSIALFLGHQAATSEWSTTWAPIKPACLGLLALLTFTIVFGRLYCGMHSVTDIVGGALLGAWWWAVVDALMPAFDQYLTSGHSSAPWTIIAVISTMAYILPRPQGPCPCFKDSYACVGVLAGIWIATWLFAHHPAAAAVGLGFPPATIRYEFATLGLGLTMLRIVAGLVILLVWKILAQATLAAMVSAWLGPQQAIVTNARMNAATNESLKRFTSPDLALYYAQNICRIMVYGGVGFIACYTAPVSFEILGLGLGLGQP